MGGTGAEAAQVFQGKPADQLTGSMGPMPLRWLSELRTRNAHAPTFVITGLDGDTQISRVCPNHISTDDKKGGDYSARRKSTMSEVRIWSTSQNFR